MIEYYYQKSKAYEDANKKKTENENKLKILWFSKHAKLLSEGRILDPPEGEEFKSLEKKSEEAKYKELYYRYERKKFNIEEEKEATPEEKAVLENQFIEEYYIYTD